MDGGNIHTVPWKHYLGDSSFHTELFGAFPVTSNLEIYLLSYMNKSVSLEIIWNCKGAGDMVSEFCVPMEEEMIRQGTLE